MLEADGELAGYCSLISRGPDHIELEDLFVEPQRIGKGYAKQLWDFSVNLARELGFRTVVLTADPTPSRFTFARVVSVSAKKHLRFARTAGFPSWSTASADEPQ